MEMPLPSYRLFRLDPANGQRRPGEWLDAVDDDDALERARGLSADARCEVWLQARLVGILIPAV